KATMDLIKNPNLPEDFIEFISRNYERIEEIEKKIEEFKISFRNSKNFKHLFNLKYQKLFESVDSCFSEGDIKKVISAKIKPRLLKLRQNHSSVTLMMRK